MAVGFKSQLKKDSCMGHICCGSAIIERLGAFLSTRLQTAQPNLEENSVALVLVSRVSVISKRKFGIEIMSQSDSISGAMETEGGMIDVNKRCVSPPCGCRG